MSTAGVSPLPLFAFFAPSFINDGQMVYVAVIWLFTVASLAVTLRQGRLGDREFMVIGLGAMVCIFGASLVVTDPAAARAIVSLLAVLPAIAAMGSSRWVTGAFTLIAVSFAVTSSVVEVTSSTALLVAGTAAVITVIVPVSMVAALRASLRMAMDKLARLGETDPLTGLLNRRGLLKRSGGLLDAVTKAGGCVGFMMIDVDNFKTVNDTYGHAFGDSELRGTAAAIRRTSGSDALVSRIGGEEFVVMSAVNGAAELVQIAERIREGVADECMVTISVGAVCAPVERTAQGSPNIDEVIDSLTRSADKCVYSAKDTGRDRVMSCEISQIAWVPGAPSELEHEISDERSTSILDLVRRTNPGPG
ncbi:GGDEF domain-containing protein [Williamsia muralis]|uniref:GGDEF domain-containing protein n=1 Tax=Williamsia marianensis TaxID=85044 RepID=UPI003F5CBD20